MRVHDDLCARYMRECDREIMREFKLGGINEVRASALCSAVWTILATKMQLDVQGKERAAFERGRKIGFRDGLHAQERQKEISEQFKRRLPADERVHARFDGDTVTGGKDWGR